MNRRLSPRLCTDVWSWSSCLQWWRHTSRGFSIAILSSGAAVVLSQKGQVDAPLGVGSLRAALCVSVQCSVAYTLFAPPTHGQLCRPRGKECPLNWSTKSAAVHLLNYGRAKVRSELQFYMVACYDLYQKIKVLFMCMSTRRSRCQALRFIRCGVACMESHSSMWIKNQNTKMTMELEVYLPVPSSVEM